MDVERKDDGRWHFSLGVIEKWVAGACATALGFLLYQSYIQVTTKLDTALIQLAVANGQISNMSNQVADVPTIRTNVAELKVRVEALEEGQKEIRGTRGLR